MGGLIKAALVLALCSSHVISGAESTSRAEEIIVGTGSGQLRGALETSRNGSSYYAFKGIPYAEKPLRFETSKPVLPWTGIRDALSFGEVCPQASSILEYPIAPGTIIGDEDCLSLNVFYPTEDRCGGDKLPVLFFIHGGGFIGGSGGPYDPKFYLDDCIVYVNINYRLGVAGFLTMSDEILPGNLGLKDALLALRWINQNAEYFRGDKDAITLSGESAGAVMVSNFVASPAATGLFQRAILQSGSSLCPVGIQYTPIETALKLAQLLSCEGTSSLQVRDCLRSRGIGDIIRLTENLNPWFITLSLGPVIEPANAYEPFSTMHPYLRLKSGDFNRVPVLTGIDQDEGYTIFAGATLLHPGAVDALNNNYLAVAPTAFSFAHLNISQEKMNELSDRIRSFYLGEELVGIETEKNLVDLEGDRFIEYAMLEESLLLSQHAPVYQYVLTYPGSYSLYSFFNGRSDIIVTHGHELYYLSRTYDFVPEFPVGSEEHNFSVNLVKLWTSFVKTGVPTALWGNEEDVWVPFTARNPATLQLDVSTTNLVNFREDRMEFWSSLGLRELEFPNL